MENDMDYDYRLVSFVDRSGATRAGVAVHGQVYDAADLLRASGLPDAAATMAGLLDDWPGMDERILEAVNSSALRTTASWPIDSVALVAPVPAPGAIYCAGVNYRCHREEMARVHNRPPEPDLRESGFEPWHFLVPPRASLVGPDAIVERPEGCEKLDWEAELALVIGRQVRHVSPDEALSAVAGYAIANDLSARDLSVRPQQNEKSPFRADWLAHKGFEGALPLGPWLTPARFAGDPQKLGVRLWVNDVLKQDSDTGQMIYSAAEQIAHLSRLRTLYPGDVILTGTPAGVGSARGEFLLPGDLVRVEIDGLGQLRTRIV